MKFFKETLLVLTIMMSLNSCSEDDKSADAAKTSATITVTDANGPVSNMVVYVYDEDQWNVIGDETNFAQGQSATNADGEAVFTNLEYPNVFHEINNYQNTMRFSAHYTLNGVAKTKVAAITFNKGESKTGTLFLN